MGAFTEKAASNMGGLRKPEEFRYEVKMLVAGFDFKGMKQMILNHPACFVETYPPRWINNIYFDNVGFDNYFQSVDGIRNRIKRRIRWYGDQFKMVEKPILEMKIKEGVVGTKEYYPLRSFEMCRGMDSECIRSLMCKNELPSRGHELMNGYVPVLVNRYLRQYYETPDKRFRVTLDQGICFYPLRKSKNLFIQKYREQNLVLEIKFANDDRDYADQITNGFPFRVVRFSKYCAGIDKAYNVKNG
jgi:SPX domain protein involved in polyphosphate accumulation